jgi:hypothetical protein
MQRTIKMKDCFEYSTVAQAQSRQPSPSHAAFPCDAGNLTLNHASARRVTVASSRIFPIARHVKAIADGIHPIPVHLKAAAMTSIPSPIA